MNPLLERFFDAYFKLDLNGNFVVVQGKVSELFGTSGEELHGRPIWKKFPQLIGSDLEQKIQTATAQRQTIRVSGALLPAEGWVEITIHPVEDGVECYVHDVSAYRQDQPGVPTRDENNSILFDALLEHIPEAIIIADAKDYSFLVTSRYTSEILALPREVLLKYTLSDFIHQVQFFESGSDTPTSLENHPLTRFIEHGEAVEDLEYDLQNAQGHRTTISVKGGPIRNQDGKIIAGILSWMDISDRKHQQEMLEKYARQLEQSNGDLESFAYTISHDLQEPLRKVKGFSDILYQKYGPIMEGEGQEMLGRIRSATTRMQSMINDLLNYSRINTRENKRTNVDLNEVLVSVLSDLDVTLIRQHGQVEVGSLPVVFADRVRMQQLFLNLVGNGLKFHSPDVAPRVRVYTTKQEMHGKQSWVQIAVEDNGIGFDINRLDRIVQPFQRLHSRGDYEGNGIGLAICRRIVEQLGGTLTATSKPGQGSTFLVTLPQSPDLEGSHTSPTAGLSKSARRSSPPPPENNIQTP